MAAADKQFARLGPSFKNGSERFYVERVPLKGSIMAPLKGSIMGFRVLGLRVAGFRVKGFRASKPASNLL